MFDRYFPLMEEFHIDWLSRIHQFTSILVSAAANSILYPTQIILALSLLRENTYWNLYVMDYIWKTSFDEVWKNTIPVYGRSPHYLVDIPIMRLHDTSLTFTNVFFLLLHQVDFFQIFLASYSWMILHPLWDLYVWIIHCVPYSDPFLHNYWSWYVKYFFGGFVYTLFFHLNCTQLSHTVQT